MSIDSLSPLISIVTSNTSFSPFSEKGYLQYFFFKSSMRSKWFAYQTDFKATSSILVLTTSIAFDFRKINHTHHHYSLILSIQGPLCEFYYYTFFFGKSSLSRGNITWCFKLLHSELFIGLPLLLTPYTCNISILHTVAVSSLLSTCQNNFKPTSLSTPRGHLFYLYPH